MQTETYCKGKFHVIKINEILHLNSDISELENIINDFVNKNIITIAIHFSDGSYLTSRSGATLIRCWEMIKEHNGMMALLNVNKDIRDFLAIIDLDSLIKICDSEDELASIE